MADREDLKQFLQETELLRELGAPLLSTIAQHSREFDVQQGQILFTQSDKAHSFYIVRSGCISLFLAMPDGRELVINEMHPGDCFGELALLIDRPRSAGAVAREPSTVLRIDRQTFMDIIAAEPTLMRRLLETTARRLSRSSDRESALAFLTSAGKIARALLLLEAEDEAEGFVNVTQSELGNYVGLARQTVARILGEWREANIVFTHRGRIEILNRNQLVHLAQEYEE
jgi:CRP-like cAMP-binding protein